MKRKKATLTLDDLNSIISFRNWIKKVLKKDKDDKVSNGELEKYLGYIRRLLEERVGSNGAEWRDVVDGLLEGLKDDKDK